MPRGSGCRRYGALVQAPAPPSSQEGGRLRFLLANGITWASGSTIGQGAVGGDSPAGNSTRKTREGFDPCRNKRYAFDVCIYYHHPGDIGKCQAYMDMLVECRFRVGDWEFV